MYVDAHPQKRHVSDKGSVYFTIQMSHWNFPGKIQLRLRYNPVDRLIIQKAYMSMKYRGYTHFVVANYGVGALMQPQYIDDLVDLPNLLLVRQVSRKA